MLEASLAMIVSSSERSHAVLTEIIADPDASVTTVVMSILRSMSCNVAVKTPAATELMVVIVMLRLSSAAALYRKYCAPSVEKIFSATAKPGLRIESSSPLSSSVTPRPTTSSMKACCASAEVMTEYVPPLSMIACKRSGS